ncbi:molecular chaperone DnaK [Amycolatopsis sp. NPDC059021]|uniref:molecular chaperone DnaK n=1 Tax=Amycolatopsis sp. NPDC059021 TaxID=3346704 RepID=UPI0036735A1C
MPVSYVLGIDVAPTRTHAATRTRLGDGWGQPEPLWLGEQAPSAASALFLDDEGYLLTGDAAAHAGAEIPSRLLTGFHQRIGDEVPIIVEGERFSPQSLSGVLVEGIVEHAAELAGGAPEQVVLTHPAGWGGYRRELLRRELTTAGITAVTLVPGPIAALHAHLPAPGPADTAAAVCEYGPDGVTVTLATASGASGWRQVTTAEGVAPAAAVSTVFALAHTASVPPKALAGIVFCGAIAPGSLPGRLPCPVFAGPHPELTTALGASAVTTSAPARRAEAAVETTLLPQPALAPEVSERPARPPVEITPFTLPERRGPGKLFGKRRPLAAAATVLTLTASILTITLTTHEATAGSNPRPAPPTSCARPGAAASAEGHC